MKGQAIKKRTAIKRNETICAENKRTEKERNAKERTETKRAELKHNEMKHTELKRAETKHTAIGFTATPDNDYECQGQNSTIQFDAEDDSTTQDNTSQPDNRMCVLKRKKLATYSQTTHPVIRVDAEVYQALVELSDETGRSLQYISGRLIEFALEYVVVE